MTYEEMLEAAHALAQVMDVEELLDRFESVVKRDLTKPVNLALYGAIRSELLGRLKGV